jgi:tRNA dimethylallyltransferase
VNYKQIVQFLEGEIGEEEAYSLALIHNEQLARRQLMWFRVNQSIEWFAIDKLAKPDLKAAVASYIKESSAQKGLAR